MDLKFYKHYCEDIENVENFEKAKADNFKGWECHHKRETHNSDGERRLVDITRKELITLDMYYNVSSEELIFLTRAEHNRLHHKGKKLSEVAKKKIGEVHKGKKLSKKHKQKLSEVNKCNKYALGRYHTEEEKKKIGEASKGKHWYNNGKINKFCYECPEGFTPGRLKK